MVLFLRNKKEMSASRTYICYVKCILTFVLRETLNKRALRPV